MIEEYERDALITEFVCTTASDPAFAQDLLSNANWDIVNALKSYALLNEEPEDKWLRHRSNQRPNTRANMRHSDSHQQKLYSQSQPPSLQRGISQVDGNTQIVEKAHARNRHASGGEKSKRSFIEDVGPFVETANLNFILPDIRLYPPAFQEYLEKELIEIATLVSLENSGQLNWWTENNVARRLYPMLTVGDGNCLLHAASLAMWGYQDKRLVLRKALYDALSNSLAMESFKRRWRFAQTISNQESGLVWSEIEWEKEWTAMLQLASDKPRVCDSDDSDSSSKEYDQYESLEEFHVFLLANVLNRPIFIVADEFLRDNRGDAFAPIPFGGIYLPLERSDTACFRFPLLLTYDAAHFSALVAMESTEEDETPLVIPVTDSTGHFLPIHFCFDPGRNFDWSLVNSEDSFQLKTIDILSLLHRYLEIRIIDTDLSKDSNEPVRPSTLPKSASRMSQLSLDPALTSQSNSENFSSANNTTAQMRRSVLKTVSRKIKRCFISGSSQKGDKSSSSLLSSFSSNNILEAALDERVKQTYLAIHNCNPQQILLGAALDTESKSPSYNTLITTYLKAAREKFEEEEQRSAALLCAHCRKNNARIRSLCRLCYETQHASGAKTLPKDMKFDDPRPTASNTFHQKPSSIAREPLNRLPVQQSQPPPPRIGVIPPPSSVIFHNRHANDHSHEYQPLSASPTYRKLNKIANCSPENVSRQLNKL